MSKKSSKLAISVVGLGYVGLPVALAFSKYHNVIGYDISETRIEELRNGVDVTNEITPLALKECQIEFTNRAASLSQACFHIVAVPTPIDAAKNPDLSILLSATRSVAEVLKQGDIVIYESTVFPGATEEICLPLLEEISGLKCPIDFSVGYSPERINPGDKTHKFENIIKVVSGYDDTTLEAIYNLYEKVVEAGIYRAKSIKIAETAKVIENTQRDINIALMNELALVCDRLGISSNQVLEAASTKWNFLQFSPGLVGGHCIGVDPYYLTYKAAMHNYHPEVILAGRRINDNMSKFISQKIIKKIIQAGYTVKNSRVGILGLTFKEDCPDIRNSKVFDIIEDLTSFGVDVIPHDPLANHSKVKEIYDCTVLDWENYSDYHAIVIAVPHESYKEIPKERFVQKLLTNGQLVDIKSLYCEESFKGTNISYWSL